MCPYLRGVLCTCTQALDGDLLAKKKLPEDIATEAQT